jgi:hypothetical protein
MLQRWQGASTVPSQERGKPTTPASMAQPIDVRSIELKHALLTGGGAPFKLSGTLANASSTMEIRSVALDITRRDCHAEALDPSGCTVLWHNRHWVHLLVPVMQEREFAVSIWARGDAPRAIGTAQDDFAIVAANGVPVQGD